MRLSFSITTAPALLIALTGLSGQAHAQAPANEGLNIYNQNCAMCHVPGLANAPKFGDKEAWKPRLATGRDVLLKSVLAGKGAMPPKAGNPKLTDEQAGAALDYLISAAK